MTNLIAEYYKSSEEKKKQIDEQYSNWVLEQPCIITGSYNVSKPHHIRLAGYCGTGMKPPDIFKMPITYKIHIEFHTLGALTFEQKYRITRDEILTKLHKRFEEEI